MSPRLLAAASKSKEKNMWMIPGGEHNNTFLKAGPEYFIRLKQFFCKCLNEPLPENL